MKEITDCSAMLPHFDQNIVHYFTFHPKSEKPIKTVIRHLPNNTPSENKSYELMALGFKCH
jgi:hypothetical protein